MATSVKSKPEEDILSYCGSISGETFSSRRSRTACTLRQHSIDVLAKNLKDYPFQDDTTLGRTSSQHRASLVEETSRKKRFNKSFHSYRLLVIMLGGISFGMMVLLRINISVAILNMVNQTALYMHEHPGSSIDDFLAEGYQLGGDFDWDNEIQNMIMSWYMIAYTLPQVASTKLGLMLGARLTTPISLSICALATLLTPISAYWGGWRWVIGLRLLNGIGASAVLPMMLNLIENWMPYEEITLGLTISNTLAATIMSSSSFITGFLCSIHWNYAFYVPGVATLFFCLIWLLLITDRPDENWLLSEKELDMICGCRDRSEPSSHDPDHKQDHHQNKSQTVGCEEKQVIDEEELKCKRPTMIDILKVPSFYAYIVCVCLHCSTFNGFLFILPAYLRQFLKVEISENGFYCSIVQSGSILSVMWPHPFLYILQSKLGLSLTTARRITYTIGCLMVASTWFYVGSFHRFQLMLLFLGRCFNGCSDVVVTGSLMSNYAKTGLSSLAFSMVNTVGNFSVVFVSTLIGWYLDYTSQSRAGWFWILTSMAIAQIVMTLVFATSIRSDPIELGKQRREARTDISVVITDTPEDQNRSLEQPKKSD